MTHFVELPGARTGVLKAAQQLHATLHRFSLQLTQRCPSLAHVHIHASIEV